MERQSEKYIRRNVSQNVKLITIAQNYQCQEKIEQVS